MWNDRPSIVFGEDIHVDLRAKMAFDWRGFDPDVDEDLYDLNVLRFGLKGELTRHVDFEIERELSSDGDWTDWKDVYLNWDTFDAASVRGGRFKMPFGFEQNLGRTDLDFVYRSRISTQLTPARDKGVMVYGRGLNRSMTYEFGVFNTDGDIGKLDEPQFDTGEDQRLGPTYAGRLSGAVLRPLVGHGCRAPQLARGRRVHERQPAGRPEQPAGEPMVSILRGSKEVGTGGSPAGCSGLPAGCRSVYATPTRKLRSAAS